MMTRLERRLGTSWLARLLRGRRLDRNPLRRGSDRAETVVLGTLLAAFLAGNWAHACAVRDAQAQRASLYQVTATLLGAAPVLSSYGSASDFAVEARWRAPDGRVRTGELFVTAAMAASHSTRIWVDRAGRLTGPPLSRDQVAGRVQLAVGVAVGGLAVLLVMAAWLVRRGIDRRRMAAWDADWMATGPRWSPRR
jgi:nitrate reductase gamma subunit